MTIYTLREISGSMILDAAEISAGDNTALPGGASLLTETLWSMVGELCGSTGQPADVVKTAIIAQLTTLCASRGLTLVDRTQP